MWNVYNSSITTTNNYHGSAVQQAVSALTDVPSGNFQGLGDQKEFVVYGELRFVTRFSVMGFSLRYFFCAPFLFLFLIRLSLLLVFFHFIPLSLLISSADSAIPLFCV
jgi:hypothetical protein